MLKTLITTLYADGLVWVDRRISGLTDRQVLLLQLGPAVSILLLFALIPVALVFLWSFWTYEAGEFVITITLDNFRIALARYGTVWTSTRIALITVFLAVCLGYPVAYFVWRFVNEENRIPILLLLVIPFIINRLIKIFAMTNLLAARGPINTLLFFMEPVRFLIHTELAVYIGMLSDTLPIAIVLIYISLERINTDLLSASYDLGGSHLYTFRRVTVPLSAPGVVAASILIFVIAIGDEAIPEIMGGAGIYTIGMMMLRVFDALQIPLAGAISVLTLITIGVLLYLGQRFANIMALFEEIES